MGGWLDRVPALAAGLLLVSVASTGVAAGPSSVPAGQAENAVPSHRAGAIAPPAGQSEVLLKDLLAAVRADAAAAFGVPVAAVRAHVEEVVWSDGALGCPLPGTVATQALVPGWRLEVTAAPSWTARYHASKRGQWRQCSSARTPNAAVER